MIPKINIKFLIGAGLSILLGTVFLFSAYTKLYPIEPFEYTFVDIGIASWQTSPFVARLLIGLEFFCGALLILNFKLRRITIPLVSALLILFCVYLIAVIEIRGDKGNCGCFGEFISMTPLQAVLKNVGLLVVCGLIYFLTVPFPYPFPRVIGGLSFLISIALPFILNTVDMENSKNLLPESVDYRLPLELLYESKNPNNKPPAIDLRHGKYIIAYLSLTCPHCKVAAQKIYVLHKQNPRLPFYLVLNGKKELYEPYIANYRLTDIPHELFLGPEEYIKMSGTELPQILWVDNSVVEKKGGYAQLTDRGIEAWLSDTISKRP